MGILLYFLSKSRKNALQLSTSGNKTVRENITNVFGAKILTSLEPLNLTLEIDVRHIGGKRTTETVEVIGYVSKSAHGEGRSSADRQFFYINSRPCTQAKVTPANAYTKSDCEDFQRNISIV
jgi:DNA mismatch repair protein PMS2